MPVEGDRPRLGCGVGALCRRVLQKAAETHPVAGAGNEHVWMTMLLSHENGRSHACRLSGTEQGTTALKCGTSSANRTPTQKPGAMDGQARPFRAKVGFHQA